ncbi:MAG: hypothetical protein OEM62_06480 [Acidobacteriota bacterium]|nr:hypothetical protein [Acidobacteriota bacterium]
MSKCWRFFLTVFLGLTSLSAASLVDAATPACRPCAGLATADPTSLTALLETAPALTDDSVLYLRISSRSSSTEDIAAVAESKATPWVVFEFETLPPLLDRLGELEAELTALTTVARVAGPRAHIQILWKGLEAIADYGFLIKRASAAVGGVQPEAQLFTGPIPASEGYLDKLYAMELAAYLDGVAVAPDDVSRVPELVASLADLDPGALLIVDGAAAPGEPSGILAEAARYAAAGADISLFSAPEREAEALQALKLLAREFSGDVSLDPYSRPSGALEAWSFVHGKDLSIRVIAERSDDDEELALEFADSGLRDPALLDAATGEAIPQWGVTRSQDSLRVKLVAPTPVVVVSLQRMTAEELEGIAGLEEEVTVEDTRQLPVEEILRRLQAFEDAQARRVENYVATNTTHLRFQAGTGAQSVETTFAGGYFYRRGEGFEWAWESFLVNGVKWRGKSIPEIPLIQPEKAASLPVEITFGKEYAYSLRGAEIVEGRDCWVVDFEPAVVVEPGRTLHRGTVWVDREIFARVRTRAVQLGLEGEVLSNEETMTFSPIDRAGEPAAWSAESFFLPLRLVGQQIWSVLNATTVVEREILLSDVVVNAADFPERRRAALESESTMVRDTDQGLRYLVIDEETGERVVKEGFDTKKRFLVGGAFYDEAMDFPIPLAGFNWLWFDWRGTGAQANVFFAGPLLTVGISDPNFLGSDFDAGLDVFALAIKGSDIFFRDGVESTGEEVKVSNPNIDLKLGRPFGSFFKLDLRYELGYRTFSDVNGTAEEFVLPRNHVNHAFSLVGRYNRSGYRMRVGGSYHLRGEWEPWGLPDSGDYDPAHKEYVTWQVGLAKTWHLPKFLKFGAELEYASGSDLDRFSKYDFGFFSSTGVHGYQSSKVRAEDVLAAHLTYGFEVGNVFRLDLVGDTAWATDDATGLDRELLAGVGIVGTVLGPWQTVINADIGVAVTGPDDGFTVFIAFLKLFD